MKIIVIRKDAISEIPPLISVADILADLGHAVHVITSEVSEPIQKNFASKGITYELLNMTGSKSTFGKVIQYLYFRKVAKRLLDRLNFDLLWIEDAHTILSLGVFVKKFKYVLQISELYDNDKRLIKAIGRLIDDAELVFMPEYNRSVMYQSWFKLKKRPIVLPNKPYFVPNNDEIDEIKIKYQSCFDAIGRKKIILYQGYIHPLRTIDNFIKAATKLGDEFLFVVMGKDNFGLIDRYKSLNKNLLHIDFIPAPDYLAITSMAYIGILSYDSLHLNNAYCAPNKIYEYGAFAKPMVGNDIPGLRVLEQQHAGLVVDNTDVDAIADAYRKIDGDYENYSRGSYALFDETDNKETIYKAFNSLNK